MSAWGLPLAEVLRANEGLVVALALAAGVPFALAVFTLVLRASGASLRPVVFLGGLFAPVLVVFVIGQLVMARTPQATSGGDRGLTVVDGRFADRKAIFGADIPQAMVRDARGMLPGILDGAEAAEAVATMSGETVLAAQFAGGEQARRAAAAYHEGFGLRNTSGSEGEGWRATRMQGDHVEMVLAGRNLFVWTGPNPEAAAARRAESRLPEVVATPPATPLIPALQPLAELFAPMPAKALGLMLMMAIYIAWFFLGAAWASSARPREGTRAVPAADLSARLLALNDLRAPFSVSPGRTPREFFADWRYGDATWLDLARARKLRRTFRIRMELDESSRTVRATDYRSEIDLSAGIGGANLQWKTSIGIVFFQREQESVLGTRLDGPDAGRTGLHQTIRFDLNEMKAPLIAAVTGSGWTWRPTIWPWRRPGVSKI